MNDIESLASRIYAAVARLGVRNPADYSVGIGGDDALAAYHALNRLQLCEDALRAILDADTSIETASGYELARQALGKDA